MKCPVCKTENLDPKISECPNCKSQLDAFYQIKSIDKKLKNQKNYIIALAVIIVLIVIGWALSGQMQEDVKDVVKIEKEDNMTIKSLTSENESLKVDLKALEDKIKELKLNKKVVVEELAVTENPENENDLAEHIYIVKEGETLFRIAKKELGDGFLYKKIAKDNKIANPNNLLVGTKLKISK
jgi:LysM repeat protein